MIFVLFFKDLIFSNKFKSGYGFVETWDMLKRQFVLKLLNVHFANSLGSVFSFCLQPILYKIVPFVDFQIFSFLINNDTVTALFLAKYFAIKFFTGHSFKNVVNPVVKDLTRVVVRYNYMAHKMLWVDISRFAGFLNYRSFIFKRLLFKNFLLYKFLSIKLFFFFHSFFNFYVL